jgi:hypothetical protein
VEVFNFNPNPDPNANPDRNPDTNLDASILFILFCLFAYVSSEGNGEG